MSCYRQPTFVIAFRLKVWRPKIEKLKQINYSKIYMYIRNIAHIAHTSYATYTVIVQAHIHPICITTYTICRKNARNISVSSWIRDKRSGCMERKKKRKTARKRCNTCIHFKLSVNPETKRSSYVCDLDGRYAKSYLELRACRSPRFKHK